MSYIGVTLNHFRAVQDWALAHSAEVRLDMKTFRLEIEWGRVRCQLHPQFFNGGGTMSYASTLSPNATGFIGWLPYRPLRWPLSSDKLMFKEFMALHGLPTPEHWELTAPIPKDYLLKLPAGSFGDAVFGPYPSLSLSQAWTSPELAGLTSQRLFAEQFIAGKNLKVWFWGNRPFHAHCHERPTIVGDGVSTVGMLVARKLNRLDGQVPDNKDKRWLISTLAFQGLGLSDVLETGKVAWIEYRYGRRYAESPVQAQSDSDLDKLPAALHAQIRRMGNCINAALEEELGLPVLCALDAVVDGDEKVWWLEANSNPILPPSGYGPMLASLLDIRYAAPTASQPTPLATAAIEG